jgi:hypothetical protein
VKPASSYREIGVDVQGAAREHVPLHAENRMYGEGKMGTGVL